MNTTLTLYHGSSQIIETPEFGLGKEHNDFGLGFYCTESIELAKEWAVSSINNGFCNHYTIDTRSLNVLSLNSPEYTILNWIAVLLRHRIFPVKTPIAGRSKRYLIENFYVDVNAYDIVIGYRADDSYFDYAEAFVNNALSVNQLAQAMMLGKLGEQFVIKSRFAFSQLLFQGFDLAEKDTYYVLRKVRNDEANQSYLKMAEEDDDGLYVRDIVRGGIKNDDPRIPGNLPQQRNVFNG
ncbi:MAG: DUF3990 domain-containing protein [Lachnospiraceae bacterium]|nr:DUF3990 domain-containing protein [Lachnospiraceae bacterium]